MGICNSKDNTREAASDPKNVQEHDSLASIESATSPAEPAVGSTAAAPVDLTAREDAMLMHAKARNLPPTSYSEKDLGTSIDVGNGNGNPRKSNNNMGVARLKNVFAAPLEIMADFVAPFHQKTKEEKAFIKEGVKENFIFSKLTIDEYDTLINAMEKHQVDEGSVIIREGDIGDYFYMISSGKVRFEVNSQDVGKATKGNSFGELALLYDCPRAATCIAETNCKLWRVDQRTFRKILAGRQLKSHNETKNILRKVPFLADLDEKYLNKMIDSLQSITFGAGELIIRKGDEGKVFYILKSGKVRVHDITVGESKYEDAILTKGDYFGERAIVTSEPRVANITAIDKCEAYCLTRDIFQQVLGDLDHLILRSEDRRKLAAIHMFGRLRKNEIDLLATRITDMDFETGDLLSVEGAEADGAICLIRSGEITVEKNNVSTTIVRQGGYFGEDTILAQNIPITAIVTKNAKLGVIKKKDILSIVNDINRLKDKTTEESIKDRLDSTVSFTDLKKHRILGCGTFGKVWLVSNKKEKKSVAYALKIQVKRELITHHQVEGVMREKDIMTMLDHPFIIKLINTYQDNEALYMLLQLVQGGELFTLMHNAKNGVFPEAATKFYAGAILEGLSYMHDRNIVYRDLKPENTLIDSKGYAVIVDMGFAKIISDKTYTLCGTPLYLAPEVILSRGHDKGADQWSWAVMAFEMITGNSPFYEDGMNQIELFKKITSGTIIIPRSLSDEAGDLITRILKLAPNQRLGSFSGGDTDIKQHGWFENFDFDALIEKRLRSPWRPNVKDPLDVSMFDNWDHMDTSERLTPPSAKEQTLFADFGTYI
eukprot:CAMPEP_0197831676 /NCGR_PEP_ID=MMETSP1437-20131217/11508_1 /TAXON_ID=49252 ORGANISM="Eucampia antarctica, Strain CCMP1452" /NCGR_SAMPLE_ID=MMETSP1437 /ASSEMBLY_ACC=CAM_ASM_001096 /LENGTH=827 /DNA_ID=CAMNT_0043434695 /DNA_START=73 /DNA_END=2556 /DNA_ORIENTATION=+